MACRDSPTMASVISSSLFAWSCRMASTRAPTSSCESSNGSYRSRPATASSSTSEARHDRSRQAALHDRRRRRDVARPSADPALLREEGPAPPEPNRRTNAHVLPGGRGAARTTHPADPRSRSDLAGVEIILRMRRRMLDMQKQIEDLLTYVRAEGEGGADAERGSQP